MRSSHQRFGSLRENTEIDGIGCARRQVGSIRRLESGRGSPSRKLNWIVKKPGIQDMWRSHRSLVRVFNPLVTAAPVFALNP